MHNCHKIFLTILVLTTLTQCATKSNQIPASLKISANDPFRNSITHSQFFDIDSKKDNVIEGENGTTIVCPKGCFKNAQGKTIDDNVKIEMVEAITLDDMLLSNLTTNSNGQPLVTDGMIYFNATVNDEPLTVDVANPVHIEIPTKKKQPGMMAYRGVRDDLGNMNWVNPQKLDNYLVTIDLKLLDFLPDGFAEAVEKGMPYKNYKVATPGLIDSLYYMTSIADGSELLQGLIDTHLNEPYYSPNKKVVNGKYTKESYQMDKLRQSDTSSRPDRNCGIDPAIIKVLKSEKYQHTLIATREFQSRLKLIFRSCNNDILARYGRNTDRNLYELDSIAAKVAIHDVVGPLTKQIDGTVPFEFEKFAQQRLTNVKGADKYALLLGEYYEKQLTRVKAELEDAHGKLVQQLNRKNEDAERIANSYRKLLWKREKYRMEKYSFNWTNTGWINIDNGDLPKIWHSDSIKVRIENSVQFDRVYTYVIYNNIKSLYRLNTTDNSLFYAGNDGTMLVPKEGNATIIAIGYKGEAPAISSTPFDLKQEKNFKLTLQVITMPDLKTTLKSYDKKMFNENSMTEDLKYMEKFYVEEKRQEGLKQEQQFIWKLWCIVHPCCATSDSVELMQ